MRNFLVLLSLILLCTALLPAQSPVVLPNSSYTTSIANSNNYYPFGYNGMHYLQVYDKANMGGTTVFRFAQLRSSSFTNAGGFMNDMEMSLGQCPTAPASTTSMVWKTNNPNPTQVLPRQWVFMPFLRGQNPIDWVVTIPFARPYVYPGTQHFCVEVTVWKNSKNSSGSYQLDAASGAGVSAKRFWASSPSATSATGSANNYGLVMRFGMTPAPGASITFFGTGCLGTSKYPLHFVLKNNPYLNSTIPVAVADGVASTPMALIIGNRNNVWGAMPLPFSLAPMGAPNCSLYSSIVMLIPITADATGYGTTNLTIPGNNALKGISLYMQWLAVDAKANAMGLVTSRGAEVKLDQ